MILFAKRLTLTFDSVGFCSDECRWYVRNWRHSMHAV